MKAALIIAAGRTADQSDFEPEKELGTISAIQRVALVFQMAGVERIVVVCEEEKSQVEKLASHMSLEFLHGSRNAGMLDNVRLGLAYLHGKCTAALISRVDVPLFSVETVRQLMSMAETGVCVPTLHGSIGYPMLLDAAYFESVLYYNGEARLLDALAAAAVPLHRVSVEDAGVLTDVGNEAGCSRLVAAHDLAAMHFDLRILLRCERAFYGPGTHQLLRLTEETGSLSEASRLMGSSYSKGRKLIFQTEQQPGQPVIESQQGGRTGGCSTLTEHGHALMNSYSAFCAEARQCVGKLFTKYFASDAPFED